VLRKSLLKPRPFLRLLFGMPRTLRTALRTIASEKPAALYVNTITQPWWLVAARLARVPALSHVREQESQVPWLVKRILTFPLVMADLILCNSRSTLDHVRQYGTGVARKLRVLYNGKDWSRYGQRPFAGISDRPRLLFVGRLNPRKGPDTAIIALSRLVDDGVDASLVIAGSIFPGYEWYLDELETLATDRGVRDRCDFVGFVSDTRALFEQCDIVLVPSRVEPFGTVAAEGMASMRPTIVARVQGLTEIVDSDSVGLSFEPGDADGLAAECRRLIDDPQLAAAIAREGKASVLERFSLPRYESQTVEAVNELVAAH
jgi:glycosyltransferase involved in cell wall biosynthesis